MKTIKKTMEIEVEVKIDNLHCGEYCNYLSDDMRKCYLFSEILIFNNNRNGGFRCPFCVDKFGGLDESNI